MAKRIIISESMVNPEELRAKNGINPELLPLNEQPAGLMYSFTELLISVLRKLKGRRSRFLYNPGRNAGL